jgi:glycerol-3-phosphate dehydrogenase
MELRDRNLDRLDGGSFDVVVIGGGINGAVAAAALAGRGVDVAIVERDDWASFTSQESSNLVWGGFKYLENCELPLVHQLCRSRNRLMGEYPTQVREIPFLATLDRTSPYPPWLAGLGAVAYWGIGGFSTRAPRYYRPAAVRRTEPIVDTSTARGAVEYADAYLPDNDARFVWGFVRSALDRGATAANYVMYLGAERTSGGWSLLLRDEETGRELETSARVIVNATGPFVDNLNRQWGLRARHRIVYSKGIHLVVPRLTPSHRVLAFFDDTQRLFYVIPMGNRSVIGTTDTRTDDPYTRVEAGERRFLLDQINARLTLSRPLTEADVVSERSGVRPLVIANGPGDRRDVDWTSLSRQHAVEVDDGGVVSIFGGKLTDCLNVGAEVVDAVSRLGVIVGPAGPAWFGEPPAAERRRFLERTAGTVLAERPTGEDEASLAALLWRRHGRLALDVADAVAQDPVLGQPALAHGDVLRAELGVIAEREMVVHLDDFLRRRTKLALTVRRDELGRDPGLEAVATALFGSEARAKLAEYRAGDDAAAPADADRWPSDR